MAEEERRGVDVVIVALVTVAGVSSGVGLSVDKKKIYLMIMGGKNKGSKTIIDRTGREGRAGGGKQDGKWWEKYGTVLRLNPAPTTYLCRRAGGGRFLLPSGGRVTRMSTPLVQVNEDENKGLPRHVTNLR